MVHVFCLKKDCRKIFHLDSQKHWNFKGKVKCEKCGEIVEIEIKNGELISSKNPIE